MKRLNFEQTDEMDIEVPKLGSHSSKKQFKTVRLKKMPRWYRKFFPFFMVLAVIFLGVFIWSFFFSATPIIKYVFSGEPLKSEEDRINVLLLGNAGGKHDGSELTDSIIVASYHLKTKKATLISIPRDLWLDQIKQKVNAVYEIGKRKDEDGNGLNYAKDKIDDILGIKIQYALRIDFAGFAKAVDLIGGVDVEVPHSFEDFKYPIEGKENDLCDYKEEERDISEEMSKQLNLPQGKTKVLIDPQGQIATESANFNCRYEHISYQKGKTHLDGVSALKFVRSRMGTNGEGSDFARSRRQQLVIEAFRTKALSISTWSNPQKVADLLGTFNESIETDVPGEKYLEFYNMVKSMESSSSVVLGDLGNGTSLLVNPPSSEYGAWVLIPRDNDFSKIADFVHDALEGKEATLSAQPSASLKKTAP